MKTYKTVCSQQYAANIERDRKQTPTKSKRKDERQFTTLSCTNKIFTRCDDFPEGLNAEDKAANAEARWVGPP